MVTAGRVWVGQVDHWQFLSFIDLVLLMPTSISYNFRMLESPDLAFCRVRLLAFAIVIHPRPQTSVTNGMWQVKLNPDLLIGLSWPTWSMARILNRYSTIACVATPSSIYRMTTLSQQDFSMYFQTATHLGVKFTTDSMEQEM